MGAPLISNFDVKTSLPLDSRIIVASVVARDAILSGIRYEGLQVYVTNTLTNYQLVGGIANANWKIISPMAGVGIGGDLGMIRIGTNLSIDLDGIVSAVTGVATWGPITGTIAHQLDLIALLNAKQAADADLTAIAALGSTGLAARTGADTWAQRTITGTSPISVANGAGVAGNPTISHAVSGATAGTYTSVTVDVTGHVTAGTNPSGGNFDLVDDTTPQLGGDLDVNAKNIKLSAAPASGTSTGLIIAATVDANAYGIGGAMGINSSGNWELCQASNAGDFPCSGIALETGTGTKKILLMGVMSFSTWSLTAGGPIYVSSGTDGLVTTTAPSASGNSVQRLGTAISTTSILFNPSPDVIVLS